MLQGTAGEASHPGSTNAGSEMDQHFLQGILDIKTMKVLHLQRGDGEDKSYVFCPAYIWEHLNSTKTRWTLTKI